MLVTTSSLNYYIKIEESFDNLAKYFYDNKLDSVKTCIITDSNVSELYLKIISEKLEDVSLSLVSFVFTAGEENKNLDTVKNIYDFLVNNNFDRNSVIVALGGGVTGDLAGFVASTYMRGIKFVQIPTTLLSQVDSSIGGKVGVDFLKNKNLIGAFYPPSLVYSNINTLKTLEDIQFSSGMAEVIKHGLITDEKYYGYIIDNKKHILNLQEECIKKVILGSCKVKKTVVEQDEKETGIREVLNFGHTFGHAIETLSDFKLTHGHSIAMGMLCSTYYSLDKGFVNQAQFDILKNLFEFFGLNNCIKDFDTDKIIKQMYLDKKTKNNIIEIVYLERVGNAKIIKITDDKILKNCIEKVKGL